MLSHKRTFPSAIDRLVDTQTTHYGGPHQSNSRGNAIFLDPNTRVAVLVIGQTNTNSCIRSRMGNEQYQLKDKWKSQLCGNID
jgi:hypothetical protein